MKDIVLHSIAGMARSIFMKAAQGSLLLKKHIKHKNSPGTGELKH